MGVGSSGVAAFNLGRRFLGFEPIYVKAAAQRFRDVCGMTVAPIGRFRNFAASFIPAGLRCSTQQPRRPIDVEFRDAHFDDDLRLPSRVPSPSDFAN